MRISVTAVLLGSLSFSGCNCNTSKTPLPPRYTVGGTISGLTGTVVLQDNGGDNLSASGSTFTFASSIFSGADYAVTVLTQPAKQTCTVTNGSGVVSGNVTNVFVTCASGSAPVASVAAVPPHLVNDRVTLSGAASGSGGAITYAWTQTAGPSAVLEAATTATPGFVVRAIGVYKFSLIASDSNGSSTPATVTFNAHDVDGGDEFTVALKPDGTLLTWGANDQGQLGNPGVATKTAVPVFVCNPGATDCSAHPFLGIIAIAAGQAHVVALRLDGTVWTWGENAQLQLGNGDTSGTPATTPVQVCEVGETAFPCQHFLTGIKAITAGYLFSTALRSDGSVVSWGDDSLSELGDGNANNSNSAVPLEVCAEGTDANATCNTASHNVIGSVTALASGGGGHTLALKSNGQISAFGFNKNGQCGIGRGFNTATSRVQDAMPVCDAGGTFPCTMFLSNVVSVDAWSALSLAVKGDGTLWAWGHNDFNQLSITHDVDPNPQCQNQFCELTPIQVCANDTKPCTQPFTGVSSAAAGRHFAVARKTDGTIWTWGDNTNGELGDGTVTAHTRPAQLCAAGTTAPCASFFSGISAIAAGSLHAMALKSDGSLWTWGYNFSGQLGTGDATGADHPIPAQVNGY